MGAGKILSKEEVNKIKSNIFYGLERLEPHLLEEEPFEMPRYDPMAFQSDGPSVIWVADQVSKIMPRLIEHYKKTLDLKRILIYALDGKDLAAVLKNPNYYRFFTDPRVRFLHIDDRSIISTDLAREAFSPTNEDRPKDTRFFVHFETDAYDRERLKRELIQIHQNIHIAYGEENFLAWSVNSYDRFRGFVNSVKNIPVSATNPDIRNLKNCFKGETAIVLGAGPSVHEQYENLRHLSGHAIFFSAETMLKPLANQDISPEVITSIERDEVIIDLLDDPRDHSRTLLIGLSLLHPDCFAKYNGPVSPVDGFYGFQKWIGLTRSRLGTGHSCVGLAMAMASYMGCDDVYLAGIDLCWSKEGEGHSKEVTYLDNKDYKARQEDLKQQQFTKLNNQGEEVYTHTFWSLFQRQFEQWVLSHPGKVFNLSPTGVQLKGVPYFDIKKLESRFRQKQKKGFFSKIEKSRPYDQNQVTFAALKDFQSKAKALLEDLPTFEAALDSGERKRILETFRGHRDYLGLLDSLFIGDFRKLDDLEDYQTEEAKKIAQDLKPFVKDLKNVLNEGIDKAEVVINDHQSKNIPLF